MPSSTRRYPEQPPRHATQPDDRAYSALGNHEVRIRALERIDLLGANLPWAWVGQKTFTIPGTGYANGVMIDFDPSGFFTNDTSTFECVPVTTVQGPAHGITALVSGVYLAWGYSGITRNAAITHLSKRGWLILNAPDQGTLASFDIGVTVGYNSNEGGGGIDASPQSWELFNMILVNLDGTESVPDETSWTLIVAQESGGNGTALPALFVMRISDDLPGGIS